VAGNDAKYFAISEKLPFDDKDEEAFMSLMASKFELAFFG
jgi:hypothetical protein